MERQKAEARANWAGSGEAATETVWFGVKDRVGATEFLGYETETAEGVITALVKSGAEIQSASKGDEIAVVVNQTPFYGESGGQQGDTGTITGEGFLAGRARHAEKGRRRVHPPRDRHRWHSQARRARTAQC
jgi:alanyl-tRNA synthetase